MTLCPIYAIEAGAIIMRHYMHYYYAEDAITLLLRFHYAAIDYAITPYY